MKRDRPKKKAEGTPGEDLSFPPPYSAQAKYLALADKLLSTNGHRNVVAIDSHEHFYHSKKRKKAA
jgi:hypothetical protein